MSTEAGKVSYGLDPRVSATLQETYVPKPKGERQGVGLCLSGGGYRAALFHLGALRRLNELGVLAKLRTISSVSGGSIAAAVLASRVSLPVSGPIPDWEDRVRRPLREFTTRNIRGVMLPKSSDTLVEAYEEHLTPQHRLKDLPERPNFILCATDMAYGTNWVFERSRMGAYMPGYVSPVPADWPLSRAVAASSCFPLFMPMKMRFRTDQYSGGKAEGDDRQALEDLRLTDGGVYDNFGMEPVWKDHEIVLISDGGAVFDYEEDEGFFKRFGRYGAIISNQARALRKRWFISNCTTGVIDGAYWGVGSSRQRYDNSDSIGYSKSLARMVIAEIRTDLDAFSNAEAEILENHGYWLADIAVAKHANLLLPSPVPPLRTPFPEWEDPGRAADALTGSGKRRFFGRSKND